MRLGLATLLIGILGLAGWLVIRQLDADERASKSEKMLENVQARSEQSDRERARLKGQIANEAAERKREMDRLRKEREALQSALGLLESQREDQTAELRALMARTDRVNSAVDRISSELEAAKRIHEQFARGVAVIAVGTTFHKKDDPKTVVRHRLDMTAPGTRKTSGITVGGDGPIYIEWVTGSGFLVDDKGTLITNRHVVQPWWKEPNFGNGLQSAGFVPKRTELFACFPGVRETVKLELITTGEGDDDVALVRAPALPKGLPILSLPASQSTPTAGDKVILLGYPEGVRGLVNKLDAEAVQSLEKVDVSDSGALVRAIANLDGIRATLTQGVLSDRTAEYLVYDAVSTHGGSGGPLFSADGVVIGINTAVSGGFAGHNYAVHLETGRKLLGQ